MPQAKTQLAEFTLDFSFSDRLSTANYLSDRVLDPFSQYFRYWSSFQAVTEWHERYSIQLIHIAGSVKPTKQIDLCESQMLILSALSFQGI